MKRVIIESPYAGAVQFNLRYLRACLADSLRRGEAPFASHGLYTQDGVLDDDNPSEREAGIAAGFAWRDVADITAVYVDLGITPGMQRGIDHATARHENQERFRYAFGQPPIPLDAILQLRTLGGEWAR